MKYTQKIFRGIKTSVDLTDMSNENSADTNNIVITTVGKLERVDGMIKIITTGLAYPIDYVHQLGTNVFVLYNGIWAYL